MANNQLASLKKTLLRLDIPRSSWYHKPKLVPIKRGPAKKQLDPAIKAIVVNMALKNPWYGYKRIAVMCRREGHQITNRHAYRAMKEENLLQKKKARAAELYQASKLYELLPTAPNQLYQTDVTYIHIPGYGWWYAVTVIDYYSRYLLAIHLTASYNAAECCHALELALEEAASYHGPLNEKPQIVTDNGCSFIAKKFQKYCRDRDMNHMRIQYRTPTQLGLLERFHKTLKMEEVYWNLYDSVTEARDKLEAFRRRYNEARPHWALRPSEKVDPVVPKEVYVDGVGIIIPKWQRWAKGAKKKLDKELAHIKHREECYLSENEAS